MIIKILDLKLNDKTQKWYLLCLTKSQKRIKINFKNKKEARHFSLGSQLYSNSFSKACERSEVLTLPEMNERLKEKLIHLGSQFHFIISQLEKTKRQLSKNLTALNLRNFQYEIILKLKFDL